MTITYRGQVTVAPHRARYLAIRIAGMSKRDCAALIVDLADRLCMLEDLHLLGPTSRLEVPVKGATNAEALPSSRGQIDTPFFDSVIAGYMTQTD
jgi:hypothetical protein